MTYHGIAWHRSPKRDEGEVCASCVHLVTSLSVDGLCASGELSNILWPGCHQAFDADVICLLRANVSCLRKPGVMGISE